MSLGIPIHGRLRVSPEGTSADGAPTGRLGGENVRFTDIPNSEPGSPRRPRSAKIRSASAFRAGDSVS
jgi:hypothetical protein